MLLRGSLGAKTLFVNVLLLADKRGMATTSALYRADGVKITHDPYAEGMAEKYGLPGATDSEGFDPYRDTVGAGIYSGSVKRDPETGRVLEGQRTFCEVAVLVCSSDTSVRSQPPLFVSWHCP